MSEERYLPIKESLGYKNVRQALWNVFSVDLNHIIIDEKLFESFSFRFQYREYEMTMIISDTEKHVQFQAGEGGLFDVWIPNPNNSFGAVLIYMSWFLIKLLKKKSDIFLVKMKKMLNMLYKF
ncbi:hypothetical protein [Streptococcus equi]|uniref:hypothetical protein n=1 Tax=Streptococcus equi TaxID=1336 RepID=UPI001E4B6D90|nr:hypothetical protein [Streptococcus equi]